MPTPPNESRALALALASVALWSTVATGFELGLDVLTPLQLLFAGAVVSLAFFVVRALLEDDALRGVRARHVGHAALLGLANPLGYYVILFEAYDRLPAQIAQPVNYTWALTLALLSVPVLGQHVPRRGWLGIGIGYLGVVVIVMQEPPAALEVDPVGVVLALASTLLWAGYWLAMARIAIPAATLMSLSFAFATPAVGLLCALTDGLPPLTLETLGFGLWVGLVEMGVTFLLWQRALSLTHHAARIGTLIFLAPFLSLVWIEVVLGEPVTATSIAGLGIITAGLVIQQRAR